MKKNIAAIVFGILVFSPVICIGDYVIYLKDGNRILVSTYWEKKDIIHVKKHGGTMGIPRALVSRIEEVKAEPISDVKKVPEKRAVDAVKQEEKEEKEKKEKPVEISEKEKRKEEQEKAAKMEMFLEEKRQLMKQMDIVTSAFNEAKTMKNKEKKDQYWNELISLQKKFGEFRERVMAEHGGKLPAWWENTP